MSGLRWNSETREAKDFFFFGGGMDGDRLRVNVFDGEAPTTIVLEGPEGTGIEQTYDRQEVRWREASVNLSMYVYVLRGQKIDPKFVAEAWGKLTGGPRP